MLKSLWNASLTISTFLKMKFFLRILYVSIALMQFLINLRTCFRQRIFMIVTIFLWSRLNIWIFLTETSFESFLYSMIKINKSNIFSALNMSRFHDCQSTKFFNLNMFFKTTLKSEIKTLFLLFDMTMFNWVLKLS